MLNSKTQIFFTDRESVKNDIVKTLKVFKEEENNILQTNFLHNTLINLHAKTANIKVTFSKPFYIFYSIIGLITIILPFENAFIGTSALALFLIFSSVMYFSLDYKLKTIIDGFN